MTEENVPQEITSTIVGITLNGKQFGIDAFIKLEQSIEFRTGISEVDALVKREELAALLFEQAVAIAKDNGSKFRELTVSTPAPSVSGNNAGSIRAVANGASVEGQWRVAVDAFDSAKQVRYLSMEAKPTDDMKRDAYAWLSEKGFSGDCFDIWDERRDAESGKPISSVCNIKLKEEYRAQAKPQLIYTDKGGIKALVRAKFNSDGSLYFYWANKETNAAVEYGALDFLRS